MGNPVKYGTAGHDFPILVIFLQAMLGVLGQNVIVDPT